MRPPRLLPLIDAERARAAGLDPVALVAALAAVGASAVWWRDPSPAGPARHARAAAAIASAGDATLVLRGGDCAAALAVGASGAHLPARALTAPQPMRGLALVGASVHNATELRQAANVGVDYVTVSPVYPTASKPGAPSLLGLDGIRQLARARAQIAPELPLLALGGVAEEAIADVIHAGAWGVAAGTPFLTASCGAVYLAWRDAVDAATR